MAAADPQPLRFCLVVTNLAGGGAEKAMIKLADLLQQRGHQASLVLLEPRVEHALPAGVAWSSVVPPGGHASKGWLGRRLLARRLAAHVARLAAGRPFDLTVSTLPFADEVAIRARLPRHWCRIANTLSSEAQRMSTPQRGERRLARYRRLYSGRALIAVSAGVADDLRTRVVAAGTRIETIPNPFDFAAMREAAREPCARPPRRYVIHVGRFTGQKRHDLLLRAFARSGVAHDLVLLTAPNAKLDALIAAEGLAGRVHVAGFQPNPYPWVAGADLLVLSSDHEGLPNVIIEALAVGTPVVATDCPSGPREILGAALPGCLAPVDDADALAAAIGRALAQRPATGDVDLAAYDAPAVAARYEALARRQGA